MAVYRNHSREIADAIVQLVQDGPRLSTDLKPLVAQQLHIDLGDAEASKAYDRNFQNVRAVAAVTLLRAAPNARPRSRLAGA